MKLRNSLFVMGLLAAPLQAANEITGDIPVELARTLLGMAPGQDVALYSDIPEGFPGFALPLDLVVVAGLDLGYMQRVLLRPEAGVDVGNEALMQALGAAGWAPLQSGSQMMQPPQTGFVAGPAREPLRLLCGPGNGLLQFSTVQMGQETVFQLSYNPLPPGAMGPCNEPQLGPGRDRMSSMGLQQHMPRLELSPTMTTQGRGLRPSGSMGSATYYESAASASTDLSLPQLFRYFAEQIEAQGWEPDISTMGERMANGFWRKQPEPDLELVGILTVLQGAEDNHELQFRVQRLGAGGNNAAIGIRSVSP